MMKQLLLILLLLPVLSHARLTGRDSIKFNQAIDESDTPTATYIGTATRGTSTSTAFWRIQRVTESGGMTFIDWSGATQDFTQDWSTRTTNAYN